MAKGFSAAHTDLLVGFGDGWPQWDESDRGDSHGSVDDAY